MLEALPQLLMLAGVVLLACVSPGPDFVAVTSHALAGRRGGLGVAVGIALGCLVLASVAMVGFGLLLTQVSWAYSAIRLIGGAYLIWLGLKMLRGALRRSADMTVAVGATMDFATGVRRGLAVNLTNPKAATFFGSLFVSVLPAGAPLAVYLAALAVVTLVSAAWFALVALLFSGTRMRALYASARRGIDGVMGAILVTLGIRLAATS